MKSIIKVKLIYIDDLNRKVSLNNFIVPRKEILQLSFNLWNYKDLLQYIKIRGQTDAFGAVR